MGVAGIRFERVVDEGESFFPEACADELDAGDQAVVVIHGGFERGGSGDVSQ